MIAQPHVTERGRRVAARQRALMVVATAVVALVGGACASDIPAPVGQASTAPTLEGEVRDAHGAPLEGATVVAEAGPQGLRLTAEARELGPGSHPPGVPTATTDARGHFRVPGLPVGPVSLMVEAADHVGLAIVRDLTWLEGRLTIVLAFGDDEVVTWNPVLRAPHSVAMTLRDAYDLAISRGFDHNNLRVIDSIPPSQTEIVVRLTRAEIPSAWIAGRISSSELPSDDLKLESLDRPETERLLWTGAAFVVGPLRPGRYRLSGKPGRMTPIEAAVAGDQRVDVGEVKFIPK